MRVYAILFLLMLGSCHSRVPHNPDLPDAFPEGDWWEFHVNYYEQHQPGIRPGKEATTEKEYTDTIKDSVVTIREWRDDEGRLFARNVKWPGTLESDTFYYKNGNKLLIRWHEETENPVTYLYDYYILLYFDHGERPLWRTTRIHEPDTMMNYRQYYNRDGELLPEKHEIPLFRE